MDDPPADQHAQREAGSGADAEEQQTIEDGRCDAGERRQVAVGNVR
jgi:hypothetical protein